MKEEIKQGGDKTCKFIEPDFNNCNLNISSTLAEFLGVQNNNAIIPELKSELQKGYRNVIFICFDGMGINPLKINLSENSILRKNIVKTLVSTFPSTTTNATTSLATNKLPLEHGWLGWSLHIDEINENVDIYLNTISESGIPIEFSSPLSNNTDYYFNYNKSDYVVDTIFPPYIKVKNEMFNHPASDVFEITSEIRSIISSGGKHFIYAYMDNPDAIMHKEGVTSLKAHNNIQNINDEIEKLFNEIDNSLIIITSDHGQIDVEGYVEFFKDSELLEMLECMPFLDARTPAFKVKKGKRAEFKQKFTQKYGEDFVLFESKELVDRGYFGSRGRYGYLLGDFIAVGTYTHKQFLANANYPKFKGHHTSLTEEMEVPLIILKKPKK